MCSYCVLLREAQSHIGFLVNAYFLLWMFASAVCIFSSYCADVPCLVASPATRATIQKMNRALGWVARHGRRYNRVQIMQRQIAGYEMLLWDATAWCYKIKYTWVQNILVRHFQTGGYKSCSARQDATIGCCDATTVYIQDVWAHNRWYDT